MTNLRHAKIIELIHDREISTQGQLLDALRQEGFDVTQATVSRDVRRLGLAKRMGTSGQRHYVLEDKTRDKGKEALLRIFRDSVVSIERSINLIVLKTLDGVASAAAEAIDRLDFPEVLGTIAGDNTIFVAATSEESAQETAARFSVLLHTGEQQI